MEEFLFGRRPSRRQRSREQLEENIRRGRAAEDSYRFNAALRGVEVERTGRGSDFIERERDIWTGRVRKTTRVEVKSGNAELSDLQEKTKKKGGRYRVERYNPPIY